MFDTNPVLREKIVLKLLEKENYFLDPPFNIVIASAILCKYITTGEIPTSNGWKDNHLIMDELIEKVIIDLRKERENSVQTADYKTDPNNSFIEKLFRFLRF
jgi:hypothetical protein